MADHWCCQELVRLFAYSDSWFIGNLFWIFELKCFLKIDSDDEEEQPDYVQLTQNHKVAIRAIRRVNHQELIIHTLKNKIYSKHINCYCTLISSGHFFGEFQFRNTLIFICRWSLWLLDESSKKPWSLTMSKMSSNNIQPAMSISSVESKYCKPGSFTIDLFKELELIELLMNASDWIKFWVSKAQKPRIYPKWNSNAWPRGSCGLRSRWGY